MTGVQSNAVPAAAALPTLSSLQHYIRDQTSSNKVTSTRELVSQRVPGYSPKIAPKTREYLGFPPPPAFASTAVLVGREYPQGYVHLYCPVITHLTVRVDVTTTATTTTTTTTTTTSSSSSLMKFASIFTKRLKGSEAARNSRNA